MQSLNLNPKLLKRLFISASLLRWNDRASPLEFWELDKQAYKLILAFVFARIEEDLGADIDYSRLAHLFFFGFFERVVLTDIKQPLFERLKRECAKEFAAYVANEIKDEVGGYEFFRDLEDSIARPEDSLESKVLAAAHLYSSKWEFDLIHDFNPNLYDVRKIKSEIDSQCDKSASRGLLRLKEDKDFRDCLGLFAELRFQKRWSLTPRVPQTSVLGHTLIVAMCAYLLSIDLGFSEKMQVDHLFCGLFHDLPEVLTRDLISPVKKSVKGLDAFLKKIEEEEVESKIISKLPSFIGGDLEYWTKNEFENRFLDSNGRVCVAERVEDLLVEGVRRPIAGELLKFCDRFSAFLEARISIHHGISSEILRSGVASAYNELKSKEILGFKLGRLVLDFEDSLT